MVGERTSCRICGLDTANTSLCDWHAAHIVNRCQNGESTRQIAESYSRPGHEITRNQVIAWSNRNKPEGMKHHPKRNKNFTPRPALKAIAAAAAAVAAEEARQADLSKVNKDLKANGCAFPVGDFDTKDWGYCNQRKVRGSYCQAHYSLTHEPMTSVRARRAAGETGFRKGKLAPVQAHQ